MGLLYKKNGEEYFEFDKILRNGYKINEQPNVIAQKQMANGKRKKLITTYTDCVISVDLGLLDMKTYLEYKPYLTDGQYKYYSDDGTMKEAMFLVTRPEVELEYDFGNDKGIEDMTIKLEKSDDIDNS